MDLGSAQAAYSLAKLYEKGDSTKRQVNTALDWYQKAADMGHPEAEKDKQRLSEKNLSDFRKLRVASWIMGLLFFYYGTDRLASSSSTRPGDVPILVLCGLFTALLIYLRYRLCEVP